MLPNMHLADFIRLGELAGNPAASKGDAFAASASFICRRTTVILQRALTERLGHQ